MNRTRRTIAATALLLACSGCAAPRPSDPSHSADADCGSELVTVFSAAISKDPSAGASFRVFRASQLPGGSVVLSYDPETPGAGDEDAPSNPKLVEVAPDGSVTRVRPPDVDGLVVSVGVQPLVADADGKLYLFDDVNSRVISRQGDEWETVAAVPPEQTFGIPYGLIGPDGFLYVILTTSIARVERDGALTPVVGATAREIGDIPFPEAPPKGSPGPAAAATLPLLTGAALQADGSFLVTSREFLFLVSPEGLISTLFSAFPGASPSEQISLPPGLDPLGTPRLTGVALDRGGAIVLADTGQQRLLQFFDSTVTVLAENVSGIEGNTSFDRSFEAGLLIERNGGEVLCALEI